MRDRCFIRFLLCELAFLPSATVTRFHRPQCANDGRLLFMTYNGYVMLAVAVGAFVGYMAFGGGSDGGSAAKSVACH